MEISESGYFKGNIQIAVAEIKGHFEGDLVERGGKMSGDIKLISADTSENETNASPRMPSAKAFHIGMAFLMCLLTACAKHDVPPTTAAPPPEPPKAHTNSGTVASSVSRPKPKIVEPNIDDNPNQLLGLAPSNVSDRLGLPGFVRRDGDAEIWQYLAEACVLDVYLYSKDNTFTVIYVELRGRVAATLSRRDCFVELLQAHFDTTRG